MSTTSPAVKAPSTPKKTSRRPRVDVYEMAAAAVIAAMDRGQIPWRMPWKAGNGALPQNLATRRPYRGINVFLLAMAGYDSPYWMTYKQATALGAQVRKGEKSTTAVLWKQTRQDLKTAAQIARARADGLKVKKDDRGTYVLRILARAFPLFNAAQVDGLTDVPAVESIADVAWEPTARAEEIAAGYAHGPSVGEGGTSATYAPVRDHVQMPDRGRFDTATDWHATLFHELAHSTGHPARLNRPDLLDQDATFGSKKYAREELTAEMGAAMLCAVAGIDTAPLIEQTAAYVQHWQQAIGEDRKIVVIAAQRAQKSADRILGEDPTTDNDDQTEATR